MDTKILVRIGAVAFIAVASSATIIELSRKEKAEVGPARPAQVGAADPLQAELFRCQSLGEAGPRDPACLRAWAESRRRFLTPSMTNSQSASGSSETSDDVRSGGPAPNGE